MAKAGRVLNNLCKALVLGVEGAKSGSDVYGEEPLLCAEQLEVSVLTKGWQMQTSQVYTFYAII